MKTIKRIAAVLFVIALAAASNWDLPPQTKEKPEELRIITHRVIIDGDVYEGVYIPEEWIQQHQEPLESWAGAIPEEYMEGGKE